MQTVAAARPTLALIAHDTSKPLLLDWVARHEATLARFNLIATGTTGARIAERFPALDVEPLLSGPLGGDLQIGSRIADGLVAALVFLFDPLWAQPHEPDVRALIRIAALRDIPVALNRASAELLARQLPLLLDDSPNHI